MSQAEVAAQLGISACYLSQILNAVREPGRKAQIRIYEGTGGAVTPDSWLPLPPTTYPPASMSEDEFIEP